MKSRESEAGEDGGRRGEAPGGGRDSERECEVFSRIHFREFSDRSGGLSGSILAFRPRIWGPGPATCRRRPTGEGQRGVGNQNLTNPARRGEHGGRRCVGRVLVEGLGSGLRAYVRPGCLARRAGQRWSLVEKGGVIGAGSSKWCGGPSNDRADSRFSPEAGTAVEPGLARANVVFAFQQM